MRNHGSKRTESLLALDLIKNINVKQDCSPYILLVTCYMNLCHKLNVGKIDLRGKRVSKIGEEEQCMMKLKKMGINDYHIFSEPLYNVLCAINFRITVEGIDISEKIKNKDFRFYTKDEPALSLEMSNAISTLAKQPKNICPEFSEIGRRKRTEKADKFAIKMFKVINNLKNKEHISTYRETVNALNNKGIPTSLGKKWHVNTLQILHNRWKELGLENIEKSSNINMRP